MGGPSLVHYVSNEESLTGGAYVNLATVGPILTVPLTGDYRYAWKCNSLAPPAGAVHTAAALSINDAAVTSQTEMIVTISAANYRAVVSNQGDISLTAGQTLRMKFYADGTGTYFRYRRLELIPVRF